MSQSNEIGPVEAEAMADAVWAVAAALGAGNGFGLPGDWRVRGPITVDSNSYIPPKGVTAVDIERRIRGMEEGGLRVTFVGLVTEGCFAGWWCVRGTSTPAGDEDPVVRWHVLDDLVVERHAYVPRVGLIAIELATDAVLALGLRVVKSVRVTEGEFAGWWHIHATSAPAGENEVPVVDSLHAAW
jgi:hypothetical protein